MKRYFIGIVTLMTILSTVSCREIKTPVDEDATFGKLILTTNIDGNYVLKGAPADPVVNVEELNVSILKYNGDATVLPTEIHKWKMKDMPEKVGLDVGKYAAQIATIEGAQPTVSDVPYFMGKADFNIAISEETKLNVTVSIQDCKLEIATSEKFNASFSDWSVDVMAKTDLVNSLVKMNKTKAMKYLKPVPFVLNVAATKQYASDKPMWKKTIEMEVPQKGDLFKVLLDIEEATGTVTVTVTIDNKMTEKEVVIDIPVDDEDLGNGGTLTPDPNPKPDPDPTPTPTPDPELPVPTIQGLDGLNIDEPLVLTMGVDIVNQQSNVPVKIAIEAEDGGISSLKVKIESEEVWFMIAVNAMFGGTNTFDIANLEEGSDAKTNLISLGIISADEVIKGKTEYVFDITGFMGLLMVNNPSTNSYDFTLTAQDGNTEHAPVEKTLVVRIK